MIVNQTIFTSGPINPPLLTLQYYIERGFINALRSSYSEKPLTSPTLYTPSIPWSGIYTSDIAGKSANVVSFLTTYYMTFMFQPIFLALLLRITNEGDAGVRKDSAGGQENGLGVRTVLSLMDVDAGVYLWSHWLIEMAFSFATSMMVLIIARASKLFIYTQTWVLFLLLALYSIANVSAGGLIVTFMKNPKLSPVAALIWVVIGLVLFRLSQLYVFGGKQPVAEFFLFLLPTVTFARGIDLCNSAELSLQVFLLMILDIFLECFALIFFYIL